MNLQGASQEIYVHGLHDRPFGGGYPCENRRDSAGEPRMPYAKGGSETLDPREIWIVPWRHLCGEAGSRRDVCFKMGLASRGLVVMFSSSVGCLGDFGGDIGMSPDIPPKQGKPPHADVGNQMPLRLREMMVCTPYKMMVVVSLDEVDKIEVMIVVLCQDR